MKKKLKIKTLKVRSFVTGMSNNQKIKGGTGTFPTFTNCNTCQCSEAYTICCPTTATGAECQ